MRVWSSILFLLLFLNSLPSLLPAEEFTPTEADRVLLNQVEQDTVQYFIRLSDKITGLTRDSSRSGSPASIAATGFALASVAIAQDRGWIPREQAQKQIEKTLRTLLNQAHHKNGFFYHFLDPREAKRVWNSEASSIDTALLVAGALTAGEYFPGTEIQKMARQIYERVDWQWMMNGSDLMCMGWNPESGFLPYYWDSYNELIILQALAIGSPTHPIPASAWQAWERKEDEYNGKKIIYSHSGSLFTYQYAHAFIDFRNLDDRGINYFENSKLAAQANREYSLSFNDEYQTYETYVWGLSASLGPGGYRAYGGKPGEGLQDGTIAPYAAVASINFTPEESIQAIRLYYDKYGKELYGGYGFKGAFNWDKHWWTQEYLGIDQGIQVLMLENFVNDGAVWKRFMQLKAIQRWIELCGLNQKQETGSKKQENTSLDS